MIYKRKKRAMFTLYAICATLVACALTLSSSAQDAGVSTDYSQAIFIDALGRELTSRQHAEKGMEKLIHAGFDSIFLQTRYQGEVFYNSALEPRSSRIDAAYPDPLFDFILHSQSSLLEKPIRIFAWIQVFPCHSGVVRQAPPYGSVMQRQPNWIMENVDGAKWDRNKMYYLDPGNPDVQKYIISMIMELTHKYNIDGVLLDEYRYPDDGLNWGYNPAALEAYYRDTGLTEKPLTYDPRFCDWRRNQLTSLLERIRQNVKSIKPNMRIFVGGVGWSSPEAWDYDFKNSPAYSLVFQDWMGWMEKGLVDGVVVQTYKQEPQQTREFNQWLEYLASHRDKEKFICGIGGFFNFTETIIRQIKKTRAKGLGGTALYSLRVPSKDSGDLLFQALPSIGALRTRPEIPRAEIDEAFIETPKPPVAPDLTTPTLISIATPTPALATYVTIPAISGLPSIPDLNELITPTPVVTPIPPTPTSLPDQLPPMARPQISEKKDYPPQDITPTPLPELLYSLKQWDNIYLKNGSSIKGKILEEVEGKVTIETSKGFIMTLPVGDIEKVVQYR